MPACHPTRVDGFAMNATACPRRLSAAAIATSAEVGRRSWSQAANAGLIDVAGGPG